MGRRVQKKVYTYQTDHWSLITDHLFLYDGWNLIEELITDNGSPITKYYVWGLDLGQSLQDAGGIGGLISTVDDSSSAMYYYQYDANGNVTELIDASDGSVAAHYEYEPYGNIIYSSGVLANDNPFRFSTKYYDSETELVYYGYRYYSLQLGRWFTRDPLGEEGGLNLYAFVLNDPINTIDPLGEEGLPTWILSKDRAYEIASKYISGGFANFLLKHYIWGNGAPVILTKHDVVNRLRPVASLLQSNEFKNDITSNNGQLSKKYSFQTFDFNNGAGGLGVYTIIATVDVCVSNSQWTADGTAKVKDKWDFDWTLSNLFKEWKSKIKNNQINLSGRETRTALGSLIPGDPFSIKSVSVPFKQTNRDSVAIFGP